MTSLERTCARHTATSRLLAAMTSLGADELEVVAIIAERLVAGRGVYGEWNAGADERDFRHEAAEEFLDAAAYAAMDIVRARRAR